MPKHDNCFLLNLKLLSELSGYLEVLLFLLVIFEILYKPQVIWINEYFPFNLAFCICF